MKGNQGMCVAAFISDRLAKGLLENGERGTSYLGVGHCSQEGRLKGSLADLGTDSWFYRPMSDLICMLGEYEHVKAHEWGMMAAEWLSEELVHVGTTIIS